MQRATELASAKSRWTGFIWASYALASALFVYSSIQTARGDLWITQLGSLSSVGLGCICVLYVLGESRFRSLGTAPAKSAIMAALFANAFLQSYEIVYGVFLPTFTGEQLRTAILWVLMVAPLYLIKDKLRFGLASKLMLTTFALVWTLWLLYGFPQYYLTGFRVPPVLRTRDPYQLSLWFNFGSKAVLAGFYATLVEPWETLRAMRAKVASVDSGVRR